MARLARRVLGTRHMKSLFFVAAAMMVGAFSCSDSGPRADAGAPDAATPDAGTPADGGPDGGASPDGGCGADTCGACPGACTPSDTCAGGLWQCACHCPTDAGACQTGPTNPSPIACGFPADGGLGGTNFPSLSNCCLVDTDCVIAAYEYICCGDIFAAGLNGGQQASFDLAYGQWACAGCACASGGVHLQDGQSVGGLAEVAVSCIQGTCQTHRADAGSCQPLGGPCTASADCCSNNCIIRGTNPGYCCVPGGCP